MTALLAALCLLLQVQSYQAHQADGYGYRASYLPAKIVVVDRPEWYAREERE